MTSITHALLRILHLLKTGLTATALLAMSQQAYAESNWPGEFLAEYPQAGPVLTAAAEDCSLCHTQVPQRNAYGSSIQPANDGNIRDRLVAVESVNSDGDTDGAGNACDNITEINADTLPGNSNSTPDNCGSVNNPPVVDTIPNQLDNEDQAVSLQVNASDPDIGDTLTYSAIGLPTGLSINSSTGLISGTISFDAVLHPNTSQNFNVTVTVDDGTDTTSTSFQWTVNDVNRAPVAQDDSDATVQDQPVEVDVQANDSDADGDALTTVNATTPANGTTTINGGDTVTYTPNAGFVGDDSFDYTIADGFGGNATATVNVTVANVNDPPVVDPVPNQANLEDDGVSLQIVASDVDGPNPLSYSATGLPPDLTIDAGTGLITGTVSFDAVVHPAIQDVYAVTVDVSDGLATTPVSFDWTVTDVNRAPVARDDSATVVHDTAVTVDVLANDSDADGDTLTVSGVSAAANGTVVVNVDNTVTYTPNAGFVGTDSFSYTNDDGFGGSATATVTVDVTNQVPVAIDDVYGTQQGQPLSIAAPGVLTNDTDADGDALTAVLQTPPANGALTLNGDGSFSYTPDGGFIGQDSFSYVANDSIVDSNEATVTINVTEVNLPPVVDNPGPQADDEGAAVSLQIVASDPNGDTLAYSATGLPPGLSIGAGSGLISGSVSYDAVTHPDPSADYAVTVSVSDGANPAQTVSFDWTVFDINRAPVAVDDAATTQVDTTVTVDVLANDSDADGDALTVVSTTVPPNGAAAINADGTVTYTPNSGFSGTDAFDYTIEDGFGGAATATVNITIVAGPPVDLDIAQFKVTKRVRLARVKPVGIQLTVKNDGLVEGDAPATVIGVQNGVEVYNETLTVTDAVGNGRTKYDFPAFVPTDTGDIAWTATIADGDPDDDTATATTTVR
jgi:large repetitive protein